MSPGQANEIKFLEWLKENEPEQYKSAWKDVIGVNWNENDESIMPSHPQLS